MQRKNKGKGEKRERNEFPVLVKLSKYIAANHSKEMKWKIDDIPLFKVWQSQRREGEKNCVWTFFSSPPLSWQMSFKIAEILFNSLREGVLVGDRRREREKERKRRERGWECVWGKGSHLCLMSPSGSAEMEGTYWHAPLKLIHLDQGCACVPGSTRQPGILTE